MMNINNNFKLNYKQKVYSFLIIFLFISILLFNHFIMNEEHIGLFSSFLVLALSILTPLKYLILLFFFSFPFQSYLVNQTGVSILQIIQIILLIKVTFYTKRIVKGQLLAFVLLLIQIPLLLITRTKLIFIISFGIMLMSIYYLKSYFSSNKEIKWASLEFFSLGVVISVLFAYLIGRTISEYRFVGLNVDPNYLGLQIIVSISILLLYSKNINVLLRLLFVLFLFYILSLTGSRTAIYVLVISIVGFLFSITSKIKLLLTKRAQFVVPVFLVFFIFLYLIFVYSLYPIIIDRGLINTGGADFTSGRFTNMFANLFTFFSNANVYTLFFGVGIGNSYSFIKNIMPNAIGTHNAFAEMFIATGVFGFVLWLYSLYILLKKDKSEQYHFIILLILASYSFTLQLNVDIFIYYLLLASYNLL